MTNKTYIINRGVNKPIVFRGLQAQWIWWLGGALIGDLVLFAILYIGGVGSWLCVGIVLGMGALLVMQVYRMSKRYGEHGLMKRSAARHIPKRLRSFSRKTFIHLKT